MATFKGFSTVNKTRPPFTVTDAELIKVDLLNHFLTKKGERFAMPNFGSNIPFYVMDPLDEITKDKIMVDAQNVIASEPRVRLENINILDFEHTVRLEITLFFKTENITDMMYVNFVKGIGDNS